MLVLSRKPNERIMVGDDIVVTILRIEGNKVRLGIEAPANVAILRQELDARSERQPATAPPMAR